MKKKLLLMLTLCLLAQWSVAQAPEVGRQSQTCRFFGGDLRPER